MDGMLCWLVVQLKLASDSAQFWYRKRTFHCCSKTLHFSTEPFLCLQDCFGVSWWWLRAQVRVQLCRRPFIQTNGSHASWHFFICGWCFLAGVCLCVCVSLISASCCSSYWVCIRLKLPSITVFLGAIPMYVHRILLALRSWGQPMQATHCIHSIGAELFWEHLYL